jgi:hypothetical protein
VIREFQKSWFWITANLLGATVFIWLASQTWIEPELRGEGVARGGDALVWTVTALPILAAFFILDLVWLILTLVKFAKTQAWGSVSPLVATGLLWLCAVLVDLAMR